MSVTAAREPGLRTLAVALGGLSIAIGVGTGVLVITNAASYHGLINATLPAIDVPITFGILGALVARRQPRNPVGWLFLFIGIVGGLQGVADGYAHFAYVTQPGAPLGIWALWLDSWIITPVFPAGAVALMLLLFPDGHLPSRRWKPVAVLCVVLTAVVIPDAVFYPGPLSSQTNFATPDNPVGLPVTGALMVAVQSLGLLWVPGLVLFLASTMAPLVRMRRATGDERQQMKWIAYAVTITAVVYIPLSFLPNGTSLGNADIAVGFGLLLPAAAGIAIFKHRLYDIDVIISRTLVYGVLAVFITAVYVGIAVGIGAAIGGGGKPNLGLSIVATAVVAIGFQPLRERLQRIANRLVYGKRATPYEVLAQFSERVAESYATDDVMPRMARVLAEGKAAQRADVWLRSGGIWHQAAVWPPDALQAAPVVAVDGTLPSVDIACRLVEVRHQGDLLGALGVIKRSGETLTPVEENLLNHLAGQAGLVLKNVGLTSDLQARLEELRASRQRLVTAQDGERRRLERNLHDGAQQHLVALKVKLGLAEMLASRDPDKARATIQQLKGDADEALETLRDLARGIYPPLLADKGLQVALESQARKATVPVVVEATLTRRYPQEVEAAVYFCCLEALQNIQKYAQASRAVVRLDEHGDELRFEIEDDGAGFDTATTAKGAGLTNMVDRFDALDGEVAITSTPGHGTSVRGSLPLVSAGAAA